MNIKQLEKEIGTLSNPKKMPSYAWGISAYECMVGSLVGRLYGRITDLKVQKTR